jgi:hypothetical protein
VKPLPPYYLDFIDDQFPFLKPTQRKLKLAAGDILEIEYLPPDVVPNKSNAEEYELYLSYKTVELKNAEILKIRERARIDFLLSNCVVIEDGPVKFEDKDWVIRVEAAFPNYKVPEHLGKRMLAFLKSNVILHAEERSTIVETSCFQEVNLQGIIDALQGFQLEMGRKTTA